MKRPGITELDVGCRHPSKKDQGLVDKRAPVTAHRSECLAYASALALLFCIGLAYFSEESRFLTLAGVALVAAVASLGIERPLCSSDLAVVLVTAFELGSFLLSKYRATSSAWGVSICIAILSYFLSRLVVRTPRVVLASSLLLGVGGGCLAWFALSQTSGEVMALRDLAFTEMLPFRSRLINPPSTWVPGEWWTLVLLTLTFAFAGAVFFWVGRQWIFAATAALPALVIAAALLLSCSRAVVGAVIMFVIAVMVLAAVYRVFHLRTAAVLAASTLCILGFVLVAENAVFPGITKAYIGSHTSQTRSTEGRLTIWRRSADVFAARPGWGVGSGNAPLFLASSADEGDTTGFASRTFSLPIQILTEKGAVGAAVYLAMLVLAAWEAHLKLRSPKTSPQTKAMTCCFAAGVIAVLFRELTYSSLLEHAATAMIFTMCLALLVAEGETA